MPGQKALKRLAELGREARLMPKVSKGHGRTKVYHVPIAKALNWQIWRGTLREALVDEAFAAVAWLQEAERQVEDAGGDYWGDHRLMVDIDGEDFVVYIEEKK